jgi:hypothetical protein
LSFSQQEADVLVDTFGFVPRNLFDHRVTTSVFGIPWPWLTLLTSIFLHGGFSTSVATCSIFGFSGTMSKTPWGIFGSVFYLVWGMAAALFEDFFDPQRFPSWARQARSPACWPPRYSSTRARAHHGDHSDRHFALSDEDLGRVRDRFLVSVAAVERNVRLGGLARYCLGCASGDLPPVLL